MSPVVTSVTVPSPWSTYASGAPSRRSPSSPVPAHGMTLPLLFQHVVWSVAGSWQPHPLRGPSSRTTPSRNGTSLMPARGNHCLAFKHLRSPTSFVFISHAVARPVRGRPSREKWHPTLRHGVMQMPRRNEASVNAGRLSVSDRVLDLFFDRL